MTTLDVLQANTEIILPQYGLESKLKQAKAENRKLMIKLGFDPTAPDLHLGHAVVLKKLKQFQDLGHQIVIIVGSFTAQIGDPSGKNKSRKSLSKEQVLSNADTYIKQLSKIIDVEQCQILFNSGWLEGLGFSDILGLLSKVTVAQLMHRHDFNKRFTENTPIAMHELMYPILQAFDSLQIKADIEMGGTDQLFNCTMGRQLQESYGVDPQIVLCMSLLRGLDGKEKMSKSLNNLIGLTDVPNEMFGKTMSIPDELIEEYIELTTDFSSQEKKALKQKLVAGENPMNIKKVIAKNIISQYHTKKLALAAEQFFTNQFQSKNREDKAFAPVQLQSLPHITEGMKLVDLCHILLKSESKSAIRRLIVGGAVQIDHTKMDDPEQLTPLKAHTKIKIGKRTFIELV